MDMDHSRSKHSSSFVLNGSPKSFHNNLRHLSGPQAVRTQETVHLFGPKDGGDDIPVIEGFLFDFFGIVW